MKGCAKFLNFLYAVLFWLMILLTIALAGLTAALFLKPDLLSGLAAAAGEAVTVQGNPISVETLLGSGTNLYIILGGALLILILTLVQVSMIRKALKEVIHEEPFSPRCSGSLKAAGILEIITGILAVALSVFVAFIFGRIAVNGQISMTYNINLAFIPTAALLLMLSGVSSYGRRHHAPEPPVFRETPPEEEPSEAL